MNYESDHKLRPTINPYLGAFFEALKGLNIPWRLGEKGNYYSELKKYGIISPSNRNEKNFALSISLRCIETLAGTSYYNEIFESITDNVLSNIKSCLGDFLPEEKVSVYGDDKGCIFLSPQFNLSLIKENHDLNSFIRDKRGDYSRVFITSRLLIDEARNHLLLAKETNDNDDFLYIENVQHRELARSLIYKIISDIEEYLNGLISCLSKAEDYEFFLDNGITKDEFKRQNESRMVIKSRKRKVRNMIFASLVSAGLSYVGFNNIETILDFYQKVSTRISTIKSGATNGIRNGLRDEKKAKKIMEKFSNGIYESIIDESPFKKQSIIQILEQFVKNHDFGYLNLDEILNFTDRYEKMKIEFSDPYDPYSLISAEFYFKNQEGSESGIRFEKDLYGLFKMRYVTNNSIKGRKSLSLSQLSSISTEFNPSGTRRFYFSFFNSLHNTPKAFMNHFGKFCDAESRKVESTLEILKPLLPYIFDTVSRFNIKYGTNFDPYMIISLIARESNGDLDLVSSAGAVGLTQFTSSGADEQKLKRMPGMDERLNPIIIVEKSLNHLYDSLVYTQKISYLEGSPRLLPILEKLKGQNEFIHQWIIDYYLLTAYNSGFGGATRSLESMGGGSINPIKFSQHRESSSAESSQYAGKIECGRQALSSGKFDNYFTMEGALKGFFAIEYTNNSSPIYLSDKSGGFYQILKSKGISLSEIEKFKELNKHFSSSILNGSEQLPDRFTGNISFGQGIRIYFPNMDFLSIFLSQYKITQIGIPVSWKLSDDSSINGIGIPKDFKKTLNDILSGYVLPNDGISILQQYKINNKLSLSLTSNIDRIINYLGYVDSYTLLFFNSRSISDIVTSLNIQFEGLANNNDDKVRHSQRVFTEILEMIELLYKYYSEVSELNLNIREDFLKGSLSDFITKSWNGKLTSVKIKDNISIVSHAFQILKILDSRLSELDKDLSVLSSQHSKITDNNTISFQRGRIKMLRDMIKRFL